MRGEEDHQDHLAKWTNSPPECWDHFKKKWIIWGSTVFFQRLYILVLERGHIPPKNTVRSLPINISFFFCRGYFLLVFREGIVIDFFNLHFFFTSSSWLCAVCRKKTIYNYVWWFQIFFIFTPILWGDDPIWLYHIFQRGLVQPPTRQCRGFQESGWLDLPRWNEITVTQVLKNPMHRIRGTDMVYFPTFWLEFMVFM